MNDEIKGILDKLKDNDWYEELDLTGTKWIELTQEETNQLLNYITNLQKENERLRTVLNGSDEKRKRTIEYIKSNYIDNPIEFKKDLLKILGGDEE